MSFDTESPSKEDYAPSGLWYQLKNGTWINDFEADTIVRDLIKKTGKTRVECIEIFAKRLKGID